MEGFAVTATQVKKLLKEGGSPFFLEVRHRGDWDTAVMKARGALRIPEDEVMDHLDELPRDRPVVVYGNFPGDEPIYHAAEALQRQGLGDVHPLIGGFRSYLKNGLPVEETGEGSATRRTMLL